MEYNLFSKVKKIVDKYDIVGLLKMGAPEDEYNIESQRITTGLKNCHNILEIQELIYGVFIEFFGESMAGKKESYLKVAIELSLLINTTDKLI
jgi:hypothetical protein